MASIIGFPCVFYAGWFCNGRGWIHKSKKYRKYTAFAATAATIVSGAVSERTRFPAYLIYSIFISAIIYPVVGHWIWGRGWLSRLGMIDFAGSTVVHSVGGWAALIGASTLGARTGKYIDIDGKRLVRAFPGHNMPLATLGAFILWFGWFGFNGGSTLAGTNLSIGFITMNTNLSASAGALSAMITVWIMFKKPDPSMTLNGALAGLVGIIAPCAVVSPISAVIIGLISGVLVVFSVQFFDRVVYIDDPVGAISVHVICGVFGSLAVGIFAQEKFSIPAGLGKINGLLFGGGFHQLIVQTLGVISTFVWVSSTCLILFMAIKHSVGLRVTRDEELRGLNIDEHGIEAYSGFQIFITQ